MQSSRDNGLGNHVALDKSGSGTLTLTAPNTYTGGTVVDQGVLNLSAAAPGTIVIPAGGLIINGGVQGTGVSVVMNVNSGQIDPSTAVTINGRGHADPGRRQYSRQRCLQ